ncbi:MAG TPA: sulfatase-like hydrolase/transferase [Bacteroidales bacterium]|nr:sulfatase-like hydrolase/transferase [Bacteroidales bacterium]
MKAQLFHVKVLVQRIGILVLAYFVLRVLFYFFNFKVFGSLSFYESIKIILGGLRFDITTIVYYNLPFILLHIIPNPWHEKKWYQTSLHVVFILFNYFAFALAVADFEYFKFNNKRITLDVLGMGGAFLNLLPQFIKDFWYLFIIYVLVIVGTEKLYDKTKVKKERLPVNYVVQAFLFIVVLGASFLGARGGLQTIPITPINASEYATFNKVSLVTNSPYTFIFSLQMRQLEEKHYFDDSTCKKYFSTLQKFDSTASAKHDNIVIIVMESFGKEYVGKLNNNKGYTPFLDSLIGVSKVYPNAYANAERSSKAIAAIMTGVPSLMDEEIMRSLYQGNCFFGLGTALKEKGYYTSFYHGGINGEFNLDRFGYLAGFDHYFGRNEFGDERYFDGNWGIYDEEFFQYFANQISKQPEPFCSVFFSLSSHHPYNVPKKYKGKFPKGNAEVIESIGYADFSLGRFFETAAKMPWFKNTLFIVVADHTFGQHEFTSEKYKNSLGNFSIPFILYKADGSFAGVDSSVVQQVDIMPTVLKYTGYHKPFTGFGKSITDSEGNRYSVQYINRLYQIHDRKYVLIFDGERTVGLYDFRNDVGLKNNLEKQYPQIKETMENQIKAIIQTYNYKMIRNKFCDTAE